MSMFLTLAYLFFLGSLFGWVLELLFRRFISHANPDRRWINPGFCVGPYIPLYGSGLCILYLLAILGEETGMTASVGTRAIMFLCMAVSMTLIEYIAGIVCLKHLKLRLWDYSREWGNIQGLICPKFSLYWGILSAIYYFAIHPRILEALAWLSENLAFSFVIGFFFGVFVIDVTYSARLVTRMKRFADEKQVIIKYEHFKAHVRRVHDRTAIRTKFLFPFHSHLTLSELLEDAHDALERLRTEGKHH
ncbi:MAG: putative ABC transporter permease [Ruminiclostridium sp.]|mgnify:FL=1|nr:putative ABC transporter permease [Ruminiclostridium sp.]